MATEPDKEAHIMIKMIPATFSLKNVGLWLILAFGVVACGGESDEPSAAEKALNELQAKYDELSQKELSDPVKWAAEDLENIGDWEYKVETLSLDSAEEFEAALNELGNDRWEVIWMEKKSVGYTVFLKKPAVSYLNKIPLSSLGRFVIDDSGSEE